MRRRADLSTPRRSRGFGIHYDPEAFGRFSEAIARFLGTGRYLVWQTIAIVAWLTWNTMPFIPDRLQFDPWTRGLVLLTLVLSIQASYAAPLILLAQNRQEARDRAQGEEDRSVNARTQADAEFLAREVAGIRLALADVVTIEDLEEQLARVEKALVEVRDRLQEPPPAD